MTVTPTPSPAWWAINPPQEKMASSRCGDKKMWRTMVVIISTFLRDQDEFYLC